MHYDLQIIDDGHSLYLLYDYDAFPHFSMHFHYNEIPLPPPFNELVLRNQLHLSLHENFGGGEPLSLITNDSAKVEEDHQGLHLMREVLFNHCTIIIWPESHPKGTFLKENRSARTFY